MDANRFDAVSRFFATRRLSRRRALTQGGAGLAAGALAAAGVRAAAAQDATPQQPEDTRPLGNIRPLETAMLFVQSFRTGSIASKAGEESTYTLTLEQGLGQTIYFSDRPNRIVGAMPDDQFLDALGFTPENPPNASLIVEAATGDIDVAVLELFDPVYDPAGSSVTYDVQELASWVRTTDMEFQETPTGLAQLDPEFGAAHLFIDGILDCPDQTMYCFTAPGDYPSPREIDASIVGTIPNADHDGYCYSWSDFACFPCEPWTKDPTYWADQCNQRFAACDGGCRVANFCSSDAPLGHTYCRFMKQ